MLKASLVMYLIVLGACTNLVTVARDPADSVNGGTSLVPTPAAVTIVPYPTLSVVIRPGEVRLLKFPRPTNFVQGELWCGEQKFPVQTQGLEFMAFISESYFSETNQSGCFWKTPLESYKIATVTINKRSFPQEVLKVNPRTVELSARDFERVKMEQRILAGVYANSANALYFDIPFRRPLKSRVTSYYGIQRLYNKVKKGQHLGIDFRARVGIPVPAANRGKVVFAQKLFFTGLTVILDHGLGIFSIYGHLSSILVNVGDVVTPKTILGNSGNTGRASGPHLHWGVRVGQNLIDGLQLIQMTEKEFAHDRQNLSSTL